MTNVVYAKQAIACVASVVFSRRDGDVVVLLQERWKEGDRYNGRIEIPTGVLDIEYEDAIEAAKREVEEETGLVVKRALQNEEIFDFSNGDKMALIAPFCVSQQLIGGKAYMCTAFVCEAEYGEPQARDAETKNPRWVTISELETTLTNKDGFFPLTYPVLLKFMREHRELVEQ